MPGGNQHFIPQFLQRGFGIPRPGKPKEIWTYGRAAAEPKREEIKRSGADYGFYTEAADDLITKEESPLAVEVDRLRRVPAGSSIDGVLASRIVQHLAPRTAHIRESLTNGLSHFLERGGDLFSQPDAVATMMGLDEDRPGEIFLAHLADIASRRPDLPFDLLPRPLIERVAFYLAREHFSSAVVESLPPYSDMLRTVGRDASRLTWEAHNRGLEDEERGAKWSETLADLDWTIEGPAAAAILPDCVAIARDAEGSWLAMMLVGKESDAIALPLGSKAVLVGVRRGAGKVDLTNFNRDAAACSERQFLAAKSCERLTELIPLIGERTQPFFERICDEAIASQLPPRRDRTYDGVDGATPVAERDHHLPVEFQIRFCDFADEDAARRIANAVKQLARAFLPHLPLDRLAGITFAADFPSAVRELDRGGLPPFDSAKPENAIANAILVLRDSKVMGHPVFDARIGAALIDEDARTVDWACNVVAVQLARVVLIGMIDRTLPGWLLTRIEDPIDADLYGSIDAALHCFISHRIGRIFGNKQAMCEEASETLLIALGRMHEQITAERLAYAHHRDVERLLAVSLGPISFVLQHAAELIALSEGASPRPWENGSLALELERLQLAHWLTDFARDLEQFWARVGTWTSTEEFRRFGRHTERLLWAFSIFPWHSPEGPRVEVWIREDEAHELVEARH